MTESGVATAAGTHAFAWAPYVSRFQTGEWRAPIFRDMILEDVRRVGLGATLLDIGCGRGFDDSPEIQAELAGECAGYIGIEPDTEFAAPACCTQFHHAFIEAAPIEPGSVDIAFAIFVIEHVPEPKPFFEAVHRALKPGGIFWGFTVDARTPFAAASSLMKVAGVKDRFLDAMFGRREERHSNYPTYYAANSPRKLAGTASSFSLVETQSLHHVGIIDGVVPAPLRPLSRALDHATLALGLPGTNLAVRMVK